MVHIAVTHPYQHFLVVNALDPITLTHKTRLCVFVLSSKKQRGCARLLTSTNNSNHSTSEGLYAYLTTPVT